MLIAVATGWLCVAIAIAIAPERVREVCAKEGACEIVSHVLLLFATLGWIAAAWRAKRGDARPWALVLVGLACLVVLGEELDWGGVLGLHAVRANVHNAASGHSYLVFALAAPVLAVVALGRGAWARGWRLRLGAWAPRPSDGGAALLVLAVALATALVQPGWDSEIDEVAELFGYAIVAALALRGHIADQSALSSKPTRQRTPLASPDR